MATLNLNALTQSIPTPQEDQPMHKLINKRNAEQVRRIPAPGNRPIDPLALLCSCGNVFHVVRGTRQTTCNGCARSGLFSAMADAAKVSIQSSVLLPR